MLNCDCLAREFHFLNNLFLFSARIFNDACLLKEDDEEELKYNWVKCGFQLLMQMHIVAVSH